ncbi:MAG: class I SAM-dependent methyltransferase [Reyranella sp.]|nr:class I SAM-dependent methyltransferase [Reyranella sp.]
MNDAADGYRTDIDYTYSYHSELNPLRLRLAFLSAGLPAPAVGTACELGFGQGVSLAIHAAASAVRWHGTDITPAHAGFAQNLAAAAGAEVGLHSDSFVDFSGRDLPMFDYIGLHGVWSWISDGNRDAIVAFIRRRLKPGGVVYMGYNALPGWAAFSPLRHLLVEHANRTGSEGTPIAERIDDAVGFLDRLLATNPAFARDNPGIVDSFKALREDDRHYLAHEFFNRDWQPMHFTTVTRWLAPADVGYACSTDFADHIDSMGLSAAQRSLLADVGDSGLRETVKDLIVNPRFRRDYWVKGTGQLSTTDRAEALRGERVVAVVRPLELPLKLRAALALGQTGPGEAAYGAVLEVLGDGKVRSLGQIEQVLQPKGISLSQIAEAAILIASCDLIQAAQDEQVTARVRPRTDRLNTHLIASARTVGDVHALASPVTGGGIAVGRTQQLFLAEIRAGKKRPDEWARAAAKVLPAEPLADLIDQARAFADGELPTLRALQVV